MVHINTISRVASESIGELMIIIAAVLVSLSFKDGITTFTILLIIILILIGIILRIFAAELLGDFLSGKIKERLRRFVK